MPRHLYLYNSSTREYGRTVDVSDMKEPQIHALEIEMWAEIEEPWVVRDSANDIDGHRPQ